MPEVFTRLLQQFTDLWNNMEKNQRARTITVLVVSIACISTAVIFLTRPRYEYLFTNVDSREIGEMSKILQDERIAHQITEDRAGIKVRSADKSRAQVALVQQNYPKSSSMTFADAFSNFKVNTTEGDKEWVKKEYEEKKLADKLRMLENVEMASVSLNQPKKSLFVSGNNEEPSASVVVKPRQEMTKSQVHGIVMLVARSVESLNPKNITVVDTQGNLLNEDYGEDSIIAGSSRQYELTLAKKKELEKNVRDIFSGEFAHFDSIRPVANVVLDFNTESTTSVRYEPPKGSDQGLPRSTETREETLQNGTPGNVPGMDSNTDTVPLYPTGGEQSSSYSSSSSIVNNELDQISTQTVKALGNLDTGNSSMAVSILYGINVQDEPGADIIETVKQTISNATGILASRISIITLKVTPPQSQQEMSFQNNAKEIIDNYGFFGLMVLLFITLMILVISRRKSFDDSTLFPQMAGNMSWDAIEPQYSDVEEIEFGERSEIKKQIEGFVKKKPEAVAQLLRNWLADDWK